MKNMGEKGFTIFPTCGIVRAPAGSFRLFAGKKYIGKPAAAVKRCMEWGEKPRESVTVKPPPGG